MDSGAVRSILCMIKKIVEVAEMVALDESMGEMVL